MVKESMQIKECQGMLRRLEGGRPTVNNPVVIQGPRSRTCPGCNITRSGHKDSKPSKIKARESSWKGIIELVAKVDVDSTGLEELGDC